MAPKTTVLLSGSLRDLPEHLKAVPDTCHRLGFATLLMDRIPADDLQAIEECRANVELADVYLGVFDYRYGYIPRCDTVSLPEREYDLAVKRGIPCFVFLMHEDHPVRIADVETGPAAEKLDTFKRRLVSERVVHYYRSIEELRAGLMLAPGELLTRDRGLLPRRGGDVPEPPEPYLVHAYTLALTRALVGRKNELGLLNDWVAKTGSDVNKARVFSLVGIGGTGKSALAWAWFTNHAPQTMRPLDGRMWWSFSENADFEQWTAAALAYVDRISTEAATGIVPFDREAKILAALDREPFLLVLDGAERLLNAYAKPEATYDLRKAADPRVGLFLRRLTYVRASRVLLTSRLRSADLETPTSEPYVGCFVAEVAGLGDDSALEYWKALGGAGEPEDLLSTFRGLGNHPLALGLLAGYAHFRTGRPGLARECFLRVLAVPGLEATDAANWFTATIGLAEASSRIGRLRDSEGAARRALVASRSRRDRRWEQNALMRLGEVLTVRGDLAGAKAALHRALRLSELNGNRGAASAYAWLTRVAGREGDRETGLYLARRSASIATEQGEELKLITARRLIADASSRPWTDRRPVDDQLLSILAREGGGFCRRGA